MCANLLNRKLMSHFQNIFRSDSFSYVQIDKVTTENQNDLRKMVDLYLKHDPVADAFKITHNRGPSEPLRNYILNPIKQGLSFLAKNTDTEEIAGLIINHVDTSSAQMGTLESQVSERCEVELVKFWKEFDVGLPNNLKKENIFHVEFIIVDPKYRKSGVAKELVKRTIELAKRMNANYLLSESTNFYSAMLCERFGYQKIASIAYEDVTDSSGNKILQGIKWPNTHMHLYVNFLGK